QMHPQQMHQQQMQVPGYEQPVEIHQFMAGHPETEIDAPDDARPRVQEPAKFLAPDTTLNVMPSMAGDLLMALSEGGLQYLLAGARASMGIRSGRYMYEVRVCECPRQEDCVQQGVKPPLPRNLLRIGFGTRDAALLLGDAEDSISFDSEGNFIFNRRRTQVTQRMTSGSALAVMLNLTEEGPDAFTMSLFRDGERITRPQPIPDVLKGKPLFPMITFKNLTVHVNFGPEPLADMPFKCRMMNDAAEADVAHIKYPPQKDGRPEVLFPVFLPGEGTFHWIDWFLTEHPEFTEISDRKMVDWCLKSGIKRHWREATRASNDKPETNFGIYALDDGTVKKSLLSAAGIQGRNVVVVEIQSNLAKQDRATLLQLFSTPGLRHTAKVLIGEPTPDYRKHVCEILLKEKQIRLDKAFFGRNYDPAYVAQRQAEAKRRKLLAEAEAKEAKARAEAEAKDRADAEADVKAKDGVAATDGKEAAGKEN
ncbi:Hnrnpu, partial [Symbiodinium sp. CCMP2456]